VSLNDQKRNTDGSLSVTGIKVTVLPAPEVADPNEKLDSAEKAALPVLGDLLGKELPVNTDTVGGLVGDLGGLAGGDLQTITIGNATCQEGGAASGASDSADDGDNASGGSGSDDGDNANNSSGGDDDGDASGNGDDSDVKSATPAPAPSVVQAALPVTG
jgi:hypothetical protein